MALEVEARFRASDRATLDRLAQVATLGAATLGAPTTYLEEDRYLDTRDGRLAAAGWACRLRSRGGVTIVSLKGPPEADGGGWLHRRPEVEGPASPNPDPETWPPSDALDRLLGLATREPLVERLTLLQERTARAVSVGAASVGTLSLDSVTPVGAAGARLAPLHVVELELVADADVERDLRPLAEVLASQPGLVAEPRTKLELALDRLSHATEPRAGGAG